MEVKRFRKKPVVIEAIQWTGGNAFQLTKFTDASIKFLTTGDCVISTLEGDMITLVDDWVIKGIKGEFYPCKPDIFEATYDEVLPDNSPKRTT